MIFRYLSWLIVYWFYMDVYLIFFFSLISAPNLKSWVRGWSKVRIDYCKFNWVYDDFVGLSFSWFVLFSLLMSITQSWRSDQIMGSKLPNNGEKLWLTSMQLEDDMEWRDLQFSQKVLFFLLIKYKIVCF